MFRAARRTATKVRDGQVRKKNRWDATPTSFNSDLAEVVIDREPPGPYFRHLLRKEQIRRFIGLLPDWKELSVGLNAIALGRGDTGADGFHTNGVVIVCAWERDLWRDANEDYLDEHRQLLERLRVPVKRLGRRAGWRLEFTEGTARASLAAAHPSARTRAPP